MLDRLMTFLWIPAQLAVIPAPPIPVQIESQLLNVVARRFLKGSRHSVIVVAVHKNREARTRLTHHLKSEETQQAIFKGRERVFWDIRVIIRKEMGPGPLLLTGELDPGGLPLALQRSKCKAMTNDGSLRPCSGS